MSINETAIDLNHTPRPDIVNQLLNGFTLASGTHRMRARRDER